MEGSIREQLIRIGNTNLGIRHALRIIQIIKQDSRHDRVGSFGSKDFVGFEVGHAFVGPREGAVLNDGDCGGGGGDVGGDDAAFAAGNDGSPVLHAFCHGYVGKMLECTSQ